MMDTALDTIRQPLGLGRDLEQHLRLKAGTTDVSSIRLACMERSGKISVVPATHAPHVVNVSVEDGVKTVRIEL